MLTSIAPGIRQVRIKPVCLWDVVMCRAVGIYEYFRLFPVRSMHLFFANKIKVSLLHLIQFNVSQYVYCPRDSTKFYNLKQKKKGDSSYWQIQGSRKVHKTDFPIEHRFNIFLNIHMYSVIWRYLQMNYRYLKIVLYIPIFKCIEDIFNWLIFRYRVALLKKFAIVDYVYTADYHRHKIQMLP